MTALHQQLAQIIAASARRRGVRLRRTGGTQHKTTGDVSSPAPDQREGDDVTIVD